MAKMDSAFKQFNPHGSSLHSFDLDKMVVDILGGTSRAYSIP